jgi:hypothetical protein
MAKPYSIHICPQCGESDPSKFSLDRHSPSGYQAWCRLCRKKARKARIEDRNNPITTKPKNNPRLGNKNAAKLEIADVMLIRELLPFIPKTSIAEKFEVCWKTIHSIAQRKTWGDAA